MNTTKHSILISIYSILVKGKNHICYPRPNKLLQLLKEFHGIKIGRRWLFQCLRDLEDAKMIKRQRRYEQNTNNAIKSKPSSWCFCFPGMQYLKANMVAGARETVKRTIEWWHRNDNRFPRPSDIFPGEEIKEQGEALAKLRKLLKPIGSWPESDKTPVTT